MRLFLPLRAEGSSCDRPHDLQKVKFFVPSPSLAPLKYVDNHVKISQELSDLIAAAVSLGLQSARQPPYLHPMHCVL